MTNIYIPPIRNTAGEAARQRKTNITTTKWPSMEYDCLFGDLNAHAPLWDNGYEEADSRGEVVEEWIGSTGMTALNDGSPTRVNRNNTEDNRTIRDSAPDLSVIHSSLAERFTIWRPDVALGSDHLPIVMLYEEPTGIPTVESKVQYRWKLKDAKWSKFTEEIERKVPANYRKKSARRLEKMFRKIVIGAANKHIGKKRVDNRTKTQLSMELKEAIKDRNRLKTTRASNRAEWREAAKKVIAMTIAERKEKWKEYVGTLDMSTNPTQVWKTIHNIEGKYPAKKENEVLTFEGKALIDDYSKAKAFAKTYKAYSRLPTRKQDRSTRKKVRSGMKKTAYSGPVEEPEQDLLLEELERVIDEAGMRKASGEDDIPYEMIKKFGPKAKEMILLMFNKCWAGEEIPNKWRTAVIKTLLKEGKDPKDTTSYRPISLTSCMGKLLEKIIADRMTKELERRGLIADTQAGFRQNRCTTDQILKMTQSATDQMHAKRGENATVITFFDYAKAYDKVWRDGLLFKMQEMDLPPRFVRYVRNFLSNRKTTVDINGSKCHPFYLKEGLPQGSAISPLLFIVFINDIGVDLHPQTTASLFADDTSIWLPGGKDRRNETAVLMQTEVDKVLEWAKEWKMTINGDKTKSLIISSNPEDCQADPKLKAGEGIIKLVPHYKFLGVVIDSGLRFHEHVRLMIKKCRNRVRILKCMAWKDWGNEIQTQRALYLQYVRSCLEYASTSFVPLLPDTTIEMLEKIQNEALRSVAGLYKTCPVDFLRLEANVEPLKVRYRKNDEIMYDKYKRLPVQDARRMLVDSDAPNNRLTTGHGWRNVTAPRVDDTIIRDESTEPSAPWRCFPRFRV